MENAPSHPVLWSNTPQNIKIRNYMRSVGHEKVADWKLSEVLECDGECVCLKKLKRIWQKQ